MIQTATIKAFIRQVSTCRASTWQTMSLAAIKSLSACGLMICITLTGCSDTGQPSAVDESLTKTDSSVMDTEAANNIEPSATNINTTQKNAEQLPVKASLPVSYDVKSWHSGDIERFALDDLPKMQKLFGKVTVTDESSLDYASNNAIKYRFMKGDEPYLDIIDSQEYLEFGWYYANPNDSESEKKLSISHAKKVYAAAQGLMGEAGGDLVASMLRNQIIKDKKVGGQSIALAKCEFYSCMLIIEKP